MKRRKLIKQHPDGTYYARPYLGVNKITGKPIRPYKRFPSAETEAEAEKMAEAWLETQQNAARFGVSGRLVELLECYIDILEANKTPVNTIKTYRSKLSGYIEPNVGAMRVEEFTAPMAQSLYSVVLMQESRRGGNISPNTVLGIHWFLCGAFRYLCENGLCDRNPMLSVTHPQPDKTEAKAYDQRDFARIAALLDKMLHQPADTRDSQLVRQVALAAYIALWHGTRAGETCALADTDAQLWRSNLHVHCTMVEPKGNLIRQEKTKGKKSRNLAIFGDVAKELERQMAWQEAHLLSRSDLPRMICRMPDGSFMRPSELSRAFSDQIRDRLGLDAKTSFHTLRHTHATWMILNGADIVTVKERLGHAKESTTLEKYGHLMPGRDAAAVEAFAQFAKRVSEGGGEL